MPRLTGRAHSPATTMTPRFVQRGCTEPSPHAPDLLAPPVSPRSGTPTRDHDRGAAPTFRSADVVVRGRVSGYDGLGDITRGDAETGDLPMAVVAMSVRVDHVLRGQMPPGSGPIAQVQFLGASKERWAVVVPPGTMMLLFLNTIKPGADPATMFDGATFQADPGFRCDSTLLEIVNPHGALIERTVEAA